MGAGASTRPVISDESCTGGGGNVYPIQTYEKGAKKGRGWVAHDVAIQKEAVLVRRLDKDAALAPSGLVIMSLQYERGISVSVDRTDESRQPVLVLRQDPHVLCIKMRDDTQLSEFTIRLNENVLNFENLMVDNTSKGLAKMFEFFDDVIEDNESQTVIEPAEGEKPHQSRITVPPPKMNVVILVVGTRGDVQPFVYLGQALQKYGHRVRLATHAEYRRDVAAGGLEFYPLEGDPKKLSSYMVKTGGRLLPDLLNEEERRELPEKMKMLRDICHSTWPACTASDPEDELKRPFLADAIISNPVSYGHIHCAEALCVPLPWSPTKCFPHPLSNMDLSSAWSASNWYSYTIVDEFMWLGLKWMINSFRQEVLQLPPIRPGEHGDSLLNDNKVPISHMWSPSFVPKCPDWPPHVDVVGEFRKIEETKDNHAETQPTPTYTPHPDFQKFLDDTTRKGQGKPVYVGFGSMVIEDGDALVQIIKEAAAKVDCNIVLQSGWTKYADDNTALSEHVFVVGNMPHDWLFLQVSAVCHHGGAGTTAAGLRAGNPTFICPFFGDQHFWAEMVHRSGAGPAGCPISKLTAKKFEDALVTLAAPETIDRARTLASLMNQENGVAEGLRSFHANLPVSNMICEMCAEVDNAVHCAGSGLEEHCRVPFRCMRWGVVHPESILDGLGQGMGAVAYEVAGGLYDLVAKPIQGGKEEGAKGVARGIAEGLHALIARPIKGGGILIDRVAHGASKKKKTHSLGNAHFERILNEKHSSHKRTEESTKSTTEEETKDSIKMVLSTDASAEDEVIVNGKTLDELNSKRGGKKNLKQFLKEAALVQSKKNPKAGDSMFDVVAAARDANGTRETRNDDSYMEIANMRDKELVHAYRRSIRFMEVWADLDTSGDRMIELSELEKLLPKAEALALMRAADLDNDGELTFSELSSQIMNHCWLP